MRDFAEISEISKISAAVLEKPGIGVVTRKSTGLKRSRSGRETVTASPPLTKPLAKALPGESVANFGYGGEPVEIIGSEERNIILARLQAQAVRNPSTTSYQATDHFIVVYEGGEALTKSFGQWLDRDVTSMTGFLEKNLSRVMEHFHLSVPEVTQVVTVKPKGWISKCLPIGGYNTSSLRLKDLTVWSGRTGFNKVYPHRGKTGDAYPYIYRAAAHEALGHGFIQRRIFDSSAQEVFAGSEAAFNELYRQNKGPISLVKLLRKKMSDDWQIWKQQPGESDEGYKIRKKAYDAKLEAGRKQRADRRLGFLVEGLATYVEYFTLGQNAHDYFTQQIHRAIYLDYGRAEESWDTKTPLPARPRSEGVDLLWANFMENSGLLLPEQFFDLPAKERKTVLPSRKPWPDYYQGGSFIQYMMDAFGVDILKRWLSVVTRSNFCGSLTEITGLPWDKLRQGWKQAVLSRFDEFNIGLDIDGKKLDDQQWAKELAKRQRAKKIFELLA